MLHRLWYRQSHNILKAPANKSANYYLKPNDITGHRPTLFGYHEPYLEGLVGEAARPRGDFLLGIGANIGMRSHHKIEVREVSASDTAPHDLIVYLQPAA